MHFPYCLAKCPYCDFVSYAPQGGRDAIDHRGYADAVLRELDLRAPRLEGRALGSVFFGGGTPSLWEPSELGRVLGGSFSAFSAGAADGVEVTVECNPTSIDEDRCRALADVGVGRVSIGVQSMRDERLRFLGRLHDARGGAEAVKGALGVGDAACLGRPHLRPARSIARGGAARGDRAGRSRGEPHVGLPAHHRAGHTLRRAGPARASAARRRRGDGRSRSWRSTRRCRGAASSTTRSRTTPGRATRRVTTSATGAATSTSASAAGRTVLRSIGAAERTASVRRAAERWRNDPSPAAYVSGDPTATATREPLDAPTLLRERIMLGLRMREGIDLDAAANDLGSEGGGWTDDRSRAAAALEARGRISRHGTRIRIPQAAWLWADDTAARLM